MKAVDNQIPTPQFEQFRHHQFFARGVWPGGAGSSAPATGRLAAFAGYHFLKVMNIGNSKDGWESLIPGFYIGNSLRWMNSETSFRRWTWRCRRHV